MPGSSCDKENFIFERNYLKLIDKVAYISNIDLAHKLMASRLTNGPNKYLRVIPSHPEYVIVKTCY